ncbi:caspase family protein [Streptomyces sp. NPDC057900]|uniref:HD domain-containing protein n=1 Tax=Streptomyces sp. NPDC057900 TaxID=3346274 RepID=UPI0036EAB74F
MSDSMQALLIAVPRYVLHQQFPSLADVVAKDVELMDAALRSSGYSVEILGLDPQRPAQKATITSAISKVCCTAPEDSTVLIHFTGHGISVDGSDYLVPADAELDWSTEPHRVNVDNLIGLDLTTLLKGCKAGTVLLTVDACRDTDSEAAPCLGGPAANFPSWRDRVAVVFGCAAGQTCGSDEHEGSHFTRALAEALAQKSSPRTVGDVISYSTRRTAELARSAQHVQRPNPQYAPSGPAAISGVQLCSGQILHEEWSRAVLDPDLWAAAEGGEDRRRSLQRALTRLTDDCARLRALAMAEVPDPWADDSYPVRVLLKGLRPLLAPSATQGGRLLDPCEMAVLMAAPFVREAVYAMGIKELAGAEPFRLEPATGALGDDPHRIDLEHTYAAHPLIWRKGRDLAHRGATEDAKAVAAWLMHRHVLGREELWHRFGRNLLSPLAEAILEADKGSSRSEELLSEVLRVCRQTAVPPAQPYAGEYEAVDGPQRPSQLQPPAGPAEQWRPRELSWLIGLAGLLGGDLRDLPGVMVDNIGVTDGLAPAQAVSAVQDLRWSRERFGTGLDLDLPCPHPAVHAAMETLTGWADEAVQHIGQHLVPGELPGPLAFLPERVTCRRLRPRYDADGGDAYELPLMRFSLAEDEMRELLMGPQLYGDRALALRELYQNALDACRYRRARVRYGALKQGVEQRWDGEIVFRQGVDEQGRAYVECEDNGVGMSRTALRGTFSRAGRRFEQSREYRREQARWRAVDPELKLFANSRFGIGVFSYFMLADEISIWTRVTDEFGRPESGRGLRVDIASSGSLFRIRESDVSQLGGGTRVRLHLNDDEVDVAAELAKYVWRSDFAMRVEQDGEVVREWEKDVLYYNGDHTSPVRADRDTWWVHGRGCLLADGIWTPSEDDRLGAGDGFSQVAYGREGRMFGQVVDLRETHAAELNASRTRILSHDKNGLTARVRALTEHMDIPSWFSVEWLWHFSHSHPGSAEPLLRRLFETDAEVPSTTSWDRSGVAMREIGCLPMDLVLHRGEKTGGLEHNYFKEVLPGLLAWRVAALRAARIPVEARWIGVVAPDSLAGYPQPLPYESRVVAGEYGESVELLAAVLPRVGERPMTVGAVLRRLRRYAIAGLEVLAVEDLEATHSVELDATDCELLAVDTSCLLPPGGDEVSEDEQERLARALYVLRTASVRARLPWSEALTRVARFRTAGLSVPPLRIELDRVPKGPKATTRELEVLSLHPALAGDEPRERLENHPSPEEFEEIVRRYEWLGLPQNVAMAETRDRTEPDAAWTEVDRAFERTSWGRDPVLGPPPRLWAAAAARTSMTVGEVHERCAPYFAEMDLALPDLEGMKDRTFTKLEAALVADPSTPVDRYEPYVIRPSESPHLAPLVEIAVAVRTSQADSADMAEALRSLAESGLVDDRARGFVDDWIGVPQEDMKLFMPWSWKLDGVDNPGGPPRVDSAYAFAVSSACRLPLAAVYAKLTALAPLLGVESMLEPLPETLSDVIVGSADANASCEWTSGEVRWLPEPRAADLARHGSTGQSTLGESLDALSRFAPLGSPWQPRTDAADSEWANWRPAPHDSAMFDDDLAGDRPVAPIDLLRVAARFGWPMDRAWDRLALYRPFGVELIVERPEFSDIPLWQDLILLTEEYTGRAPALHGPVSGDRVAVTARELEWTTDRVVERLRLYAGVFGLEVPQTYPAAPAPTPPATPYRPAQDERKPDAARA